MENLLNALTLLANFVFIPALAYGSQLALGALGVTLVYGILRFSNFAHGETMSFGAMVAILGMWGLQNAGVSIDPLPTVLLSLPLAIIVTMLLLLATDKLIYRYYRRVKAPTITLLIVSVGVMFFMNGLIRFIIGPDNQRVDDGERFVMKAREFKEISGLAEGLALKTSQVISIAAALLCMVLLFWFLNRTRAGKSMRAYSDNEDLALLSGVNPDRVVMIVWLIAGALAAIAGTLYGLDKGYKPFVYQQILLPVFAAAIVGGLGSPPGAILGGYLIAFAEVMITYAYKKFAGYILPPDWALEGLVQLLSVEYKFAVSFIILVIVLLIRPTGIFKGKSL